MKDKADSADAASKMTWDPGKMNLSANVDGVRYIVTCVSSFLVYICDDQAPTRQ